MFNSLTPELDEQIEALRYELDKLQTRVGSPVLSEKQRLEIAELCRQTRQELNRLVRSRAVIRHNIRACGGSPYA